MPGKRPKQFHRTVSLSQLSDCGARNPALHMKTNMVQIATAASAPESNLGDAGLQSMLDENMEEEICYGKLEAAIHPITDDNSNSILSDSNPNLMPLDHSIEESLFSSHTGTPKTVKSIQQASHLENQMNYEPTSFDTAHGSVQPPPHFLDACYRCSKRLGHGKDVFIYRGDRAFCSVECRHFQIVADERREKCGLTSLKEGLDGANNRAGGSPSTTGQVETAAAA